MPTFARLIALSITVALAALGAAPAAQAAVLPLTHTSVAVSDSPNDGVVAGGDTLVITESVHNAGGATLTGLTATLSAQTAGVSVDQGSSAYPDIPSSADAANTTPLRVTLDPSLPCGTTLHFTLTLTNGSGSADVPFTIDTGAQGDFEDHVGSPAVIGETLPSLRQHLAAVSYAGIAHVSDPGIVDKVRVVIGSLTHPDIRHLSLALKAPDGTMVPLVDAGRGAAGQPFTGTELVPDPGATSLDSPAAAPYTGTFKADGDLSAMAGRQQQGDWQLVASEPNDTEIGRVNSWTLRIAPASCAPRSVAKLTATANPVDPGAGVGLDASGSGSAAGAITRYEWDLDDGTGFHDDAATRTVSFAPRGKRTIRVRVSDVNGVIGTASLDLIVSRLPNAVIGLPANVKEQTSATLDGSGSNDPDGGSITSYEWETDGDDDFNDYTGPQPSVFFATPGSHTIKLRVTDGDGATRTATTTLNVIATTPPSPAFMAAPNPVVAGQPVTFDAGASTDDGTIVRYEWDLDGNGSYETDGGASPLVTRSFPNATVMSIGVRATDDDGRTAVARGALVVNAPPGAGRGRGRGLHAVRSRHGGPLWWRLRRERRFRRLRRERGLRRRIAERRGGCSHARSGPRGRGHPDTQARDQEGPGPALHRRPRRDVQRLGRPAARRRPPPGALEVQDEALSAGLGDGQAQEGRRRRGHPAPGAPGADPAQACPAGHRGRHRQGRRWQRAAGRAAPGHPHSPVVHRSTPAPQVRQYVHGSGLGLRRRPARADLTGW